ncbi:MAG: AarF/ABC1/UbiB kinase family protein [Archangiaceae bacterium]|nr:AarF/ABC1/UbiB kinase family protein [Archangiaceae bacterium]
MRTRDPFRSPIIRAVFKDGELPTSATELSERLAAAERTQPEAVSAIRRLLDGVSEIHHERVFGAREGEASELRLPADVAARLQGVVQTVAQLNAAHQELSAIDTAPFHAVGDAFADLEMTPAERHALIAAATGEKLTDAAVGFMRATAGFVPNGAFEKMGATVQQQVRPDGALRHEMSREWWSGFVPSNVSEAGNEVDRLLKGVADPKFREQVNAGLNVLRVVVKLEGDNLDRIALRVPEEKRPALKQAFAEYTTGSLEAVIRAGTRAEAAKDPEVLTALAELDTLREAMIEHPFGAVEQLTNGAMAARQLLPVLGQSLTRLLSDPDVLTGDRELAELLEGLGQKLGAELEGAVETTPEGRAAVAEVLKDLKSTGVVLLNTGRLVGAMQNEQMDDAERATLIKSAAENMGPLFVKLLQTAANQRAMLGGVGSADSLADEGPVGMALQQLQDRVTPMPPELVRRQVEAALGKKLEDAFHSFELEPIASASIGQVHRATVMHRATPFSRAKPMDVVVKVQRYGLEEDFDSTVRVARLALGVVKEGLALQSTLSPKDKETAEKVISLVESTLEQFIDSFRVEMDFNHEAKWTSEFSKDMRAEQYVVAPRVMKKLSTDKVITMQLMKGDKLSVMLDRYQYAKKARETPARTGPLDAATPQLDAVARARQFVEQHYGLPPDGEATVVEGSKGSFQVRYELESKANPHAVLLVKRDGTLVPKTRVPDLTEKGMQQLRDRLLSSFVAQALVHGLLHGDFHQGNFMVMGDGKTVAVLDYGQMVEVKKRDLAAPVKLAVGWLRKKPEAVASAMLQMTAQADTMSRAEKKETVRELASEFEKVMAEHGRAIELDAVLGAVMQVAMAKKLALSPTYLQGLKTTLSMSGNIMAFGQAEVDTALLRTSLRVAGTIVGETVSKGSPHGFVTSWAKGRRVNKLNR